MADTTFMVAAARKTDESELLGAPYPAMSDAQSARERDHRERSRPFWPRPPRRVVSIVEAPSLSRTRYVPLCLNLPCRTLAQPARWPGLSEIDKLTPARMAPSGGRRLDPDVSAVAHTLRRDSLSVR